MDLFCQENWSPTPKMETFHVEPHEDCVDGFGHINKLSFERERFWVHGPVI